MKSRSSNLFVKNIAFNTITFLIMLVIFTTYSFFGYKSISITKFEHYSLTISATLIFQVIITVIILNVFGMGKYSYRLTLNLFFLILWSTTFILLYFVKPNIFLIVDNIIWSLCIIIYCLFMIFVSGVKLRSLLFIIPLIFLPYTSFLISKFEHGYIYFSAIIIILLLISSFLNSSFINKISNFGLEEIKNSIYSHKKINPNVWISIFFIINIGLQYITAINILGYIKINWLELWVVITGGLLMLLLGILVKMNKINSSIFEITSGIIMLITLGISTLFLNHNKFVDRSSDLFFVVILILIFIIVNIIFASNSGFNTMSYIVFLISLSIMATSQFVITYVISSKNFNIFASNFLSVDMFSILIFSFCLGINIIFNIIILLKSSNNINNFVKRKVKNNE